MVCDTVCCSLQHVGSVLLGIPKTCLHWTSCQHIAFSVCISMLQWLWNLKQTCDVWHCNDIVQEAYFKIWGFCNKWPCSSSCKTTFLYMTTSWHKEKIFCSTLTFFKIDHRGHSNFVHDSNCESESRFLQPIVVQEKQKHVSFGIKLATSFFPECSW